MFEDLNKIAQWIEEWDKQYFPETQELPIKIQRDIILARLVEEIGEAAQALRILHGRKNKPNDVPSHEAVVEELGDCLLLLFKLCNIGKVLPSEAIQVVMEKLNKRLEELNNGSNQNSNIQTSVSDV